MKKLLFIISTVVIFGTISLMFSGCSKNEGTEGDKSTTIYGTVFDGYTEAPLGGAQVRFGEYSYLSGGLPADFEAYATTVTGSDGAYSMTFQKEKSEKDKYAIVVTKGNYYPSFETKTITIGQGQAYQMDIILYDRDHWEIY